MAFHRRSLTPLDSELTSADGLPIEEEGLADRAEERYDEWRARRARHQPPSTVEEEVEQGILRLAIIVAVAGAIAYGISAAVGRGDAFGFYMVGAVLLGGALFVSGATPGYVSASYYRCGGRRLGAGPAFVLVGAILAGIGVALEVLT